jgi:phage minor structural protein|nr:MAG TPA: tail protein [Caudoviricetes sp.]
MNEIRIAVLNPHDRVLAFLDNTHRNSMHYWNDELHEYLQGTANTYAFTVSSKHEDAAYIVEGNKVAFVYNGKDYYLNIVHVEKDEFTVTATAWSLSFELINENVGAYKSESAMSFEEYVTAFDPERTVRIGINEVSDKRISNEWTGEATVLSRLFSVANVFDAEIEFQTVLNDDYSLKEIVMNVYREHSDNNTGVGEFRGDIKLRYGKNVTGIRKESSIENLYTGIRPTGKDGLTIQGIEKEELDENGVVEFYTQGPDIRAPQARDRFPSNLINKEDGYIFMPKSYDTDNKDKLYSMALLDLKTASEPVVTYDVTGYFDTAIGDTVEIEDEEYVPTLYLSARVSEQVRSFTNPQANKTVFTNFKELQPEISEDLLQKVEDLINKTKIYTSSISTDNGIVFKNNEGFTNLTANVIDNGVDRTDNFTIRWFKDGNHIYAGRTIKVRALDVESKAVYKFEARDTEGVLRGFEEVTVTDVSDGEPGKDGTTYYTWFKFADDEYGNGMSSSPDGKEYLGIAYNKVTPVMSNNPEDYQWARITGEGIPGKPGADGKTYYTWVRYADDARGNGMSDSPNGKYYIGFAYNKEVPTESNNPADYQWSKYKGDDGKDGTDGAIKSETPPGDKTKLWYDTVNNVLKYWDGEKWVEAYTGDIEDAKDAAGNAQESANTAISSVNNINTSLEKYKNEVRAEFKNTVTYVDGKTEVIDTWVRQGSDGVTPFLELGGTSNDLKARLTNSRLGFYEGDKGLAYFGNEKAYMPVAEVDNLSAKRVGVGNYAMLDNGDGHLSLIYIE